MEEPDDLRHRRETDARTTQYPRRSRRSVVSFTLDQPAVPGIVDVKVDQKEFRIRFADTDGHRNSASMLLHRMYSSRGYTCAPDIEHPNRVVLVASRCDYAIGTVTVQADSPIGLPADETFAQEVDRLRTAGRRPYEMTRLAIDDRSFSLFVLAFLSHIGYICARFKFGCTDALIEVNPRHVAFYKRMLGFDPIGTERICPRVNAPAVLLRLPVEYVERHIRDDGFEPDGRTLYPYFFSKREEQGICRRLFVAD